MIYCRITVKIVFKAEEHLTKCENIPYYGLLKRISDMYGDGMIGVEVKK